MTYEIINIATSNTLCAFDSQGLAIAALRQMSERDQVAAAELAVVAFDDDGEAQELVAGPAAIAAELA